LHFRTSGPLNYLFSSYELQVEHLLYNGARLADHILACPAFYGDSPNFVIHSW
jgi:hypothetical protein